MNLERKIPPPLVLMIVGSSAYFFPWQWSLTFSETLNLGISLVFLGGGLAIDLWALASFYRHKTSFNPLHSKNTSTLITHGIYRWTRNPMYLGMVSYLLAASFFFNQLVFALFVPIFMAYIQRFQILPEEKILLDKFGPTWEAYFKSVRRWI